MGAFIGRCHINSPLGSRQNRFPDFEATIIFSSKTNGEPEISAPMGFFHNTCAEKQKKDVRTMIQKKTNLFLVIYSVFRGK
jgi:hypothetical protein